MQQSNVTSYFYEVTAMKYCVNTRNFFLLILLLKLKSALAQMFTPVFWGFRFIFR